MLGLQQLSLFLLLFGKAQGDLISVRKENETVACVTSDFEHAMAFVKKPVNDADFTRVEYLDVTGEPVMMTKYDCNLITDNCTRWNRIKDRDVQGWILSGNMIGNLITDYRWNDLPTHFINATSFREEFEKIGPIHATFHFSILAKEEVEILVAGGSHDNAEQKSYVAIFKDKIVSGIQQLKDKIWQRSPANQNTIEEKNILHGGKKWTPVTVVVGAQNSTSASNRAGQVIFHVKRSACGSNSCVLHFNSTGEMLFKIHQYRTLYSSKINSTMDLDVLEDINGFCVDIVFYYNEKVLNKAFELTIMQGNKVMQRFSKNADPSKRQKWLTSRFQDNALKLKKNWKIGLTAATAGVDIGAIKFCAGGDSNIIKPKGKNMESCHLLAASDPNPTPKERLTQVANNFSICAALGGNCSEFSACGDGGECVCFAGSTSKQSVLPESSSESCVEKTGRIRDMVILTTSYNIGSYTFLVFTLFYYRHLRKLQDSIHSYQHRQRLPTPPNGHVQAETSFSMPRPHNSKLN
ncbi:Hypothetical predicted protein [Cloeon dipterum]|uniref:EGF-like domain-containing protein n=2 Tax=Cloeon dipterum TaxID=197152 RepID=A0A8S1E0I8_9INSE|nr:Hypothetical predicted protein [Cloeon dipterum]